MNRFGSLCKPLMWFMALLLAAFVAGCGSGGGGGSSGGLPGASSARSGPTGGVCAGAGCVSLGTAANYVILAKTGVSTVPNSVVTGNVGLSPAARGALTGWSETSDVTDTFSTSAQVAAPGKLYAADYVGGTTTADLTTAVGDMETAYTAASPAAMPGGAACPGAGDLGGLSLAPGVYTCSTGLLITTSTTLAGTGAATDVWVFQIAQTLTQSAGTQVNLTGGALPQNVFWQVASGVDIGTTALMQGVILGKTLINLQTNAKVNGRLLAQAAVTLDKNTVTVP